MKRSSSNIAFLSVASNSFVVLMKVIVGILTGSVAVLSEAIHSALDLLASFIAFVSVKVSGKPADDDHPYGHGKIENISGTIETLLIYVAGIWIIYECVHKLISPEPIKLPLLAIGVMLLGALINFVVSRIVNKEATRINSVAMKSNAFHLLTDVYTSLGVGLSLILVALTDWTFLDPIIGIALALYIMIEATKLMKEAFPPLLDARLNKNEEEEVLAAIRTFQSEYIEIQSFKTRRAGAHEHIDFHLIVSPEDSIKSIHHLCDRIENKILEKFPNAHIMIHPEPDGLQNR
ncbi:cation diffusion facilitator family transporter [Bacillus sp. 1780r2a1]|uniref:cation diffusion facilitator family transporter n=1 Tax=Priestia flexa TaxID=86664 RepID=UPI002206A7FF|nr:cation diffusion facilitator family transporter [Priestia flexa]MDT2046558.1 cation diffusion facilitator family transporter [Priestia flexa]USY53429.1 cation diffusion facilitator family transporter [Bacillus sp. 1780r2a1]